jgi:hypothetical protein
MGRGVGDEHFFFKASPPNRPNKKCNRPTAANENADICANTVRKSEWS